MKSPASMASIRTGMNPAILNLLCHRSPTKVSLPNPRERMGLGGIYFGTWTNDAIFTIV
jgi:hypothetical protein